MTLEEAIKKASAYQYVARKKWMDDNSLMKVLPVADHASYLSDESLYADDWELIE